MPRIDGSSRFSTYGPSTMPVKSIPIILGSPIRSQIAAMARPARKINASEVNMFSSHFYSLWNWNAPAAALLCEHSTVKNQKTDVLCDFCLHTNIPFCGHLQSAIDAKILSLLHLKSQKSSQLTKILSSGSAIRRGRTSFPESIITTLLWCVKEKSSLLFHPHEFCIRFIEIIVHIAAQSARFPCLIEGNAFLIAQIDKRTVALCRIHPACRSLPVGTCKNAHLRSARFRRSSHNKEPSSLPVLPPSFSTSRTSVAA